MRWKRALLWFLKCLTLRNPKRIVLKSPPHTCRIRALLEMFPKAKFVHIVRDPYVIFPSTVNLWKRLYRDEGLQMPTGEGLEEHVFDTFTRMYEAFERDRDLIGPGQFCEVRYEELVADPMEQMRRVYEELELGDSSRSGRGSRSISPGRRTTRRTATRSRRRLRAEIAPPLGQVHSAIRLCEGRSGQWAGQTVGMEAGSGQLSHVDVCRRLLTVKSRRVAWVSEAYRVPETVCKGKLAYPPPICRGDRFSDRQ